MGASYAKGAGVVKWAFDPSDEGDIYLTLWLHSWQGKKLTEIINETHINVKYLPGSTLPENIVAVPDLSEVVDGADILIICTPHQFIRGLMKQLQASGKVRARVLTEQPMPLNQ